MDNKRILCLGWCDVDVVMNYGQILQACAMMNITREYTDAKIKFVSFYPRRPKSLMRYIVGHCGIRNGHLKAYVKTRKTIARFIKRNNISYHKVFNNSVPNRYYRDAEVMICGSDQIWHPQNYNKCYFLNFGPSQIRRISYAASLPKVDIETQYMDSYEKMAHDLQIIDYISIREKMSVDFVSKLANKEIQCVLDPTFLVDKKIWLEQIETINIEQDFLFVYIPNGMDEEMATLIHDISEKQKIKNIYVLVTRGENLVRNSKSLNYISVGEFLYCIKNARCVVSTSFHAIVFSIIFNTNFFAYEMNNESRGTDTRIRSILDTFYLESRLINGNESNDFGQIDEDSISVVLHDQINVSKDFLRKAIKE